MMEAINGTYIVYEIVGTILLINILVWNIVSIYYGIRFLCCSKKENRNRLVGILVTFMGILWTLIYGYVVIQAFLGTPLQPSNSFGAIYVRPAILFTSVTQAIAQKLRYKEARAGGAECQTNLEK